MKQEQLEKIIKTLSTVRYREKQIPLVYTGVRNTGGFTSAFEFANQETDEKYYLKITGATEGNTDEIAVLTKVNQLFRNEILAEPDAAKRLNYMPVPEILTDDPDRFNVEFMRALDRSQYKAQLQTAGRGVPAEKQLPDTLKDRLSIALDFAKVLRACAKNKIAYVDVKPLEHIFWQETENRLEITLIDWGISRANAAPFYLLDDIRKFCLFLPELIYGRKMLDLTNQGKFEYPIQKENDRVVIKLLGQLSFSANNPPLNPKYALLIGDLLAGSTNETRFQNRCVEVWDDILRVLNEALDSLKTEVKSVVSWESLKKEAESFIAKDPESFMDKDFRKVLDPRLISLTSYKAWLLPAVRFLQTWYGRIDLIPRQEFDTCAQLILADDPSGLDAEFQKISGMIQEKVARSNGLAELSAILSENITLMQSVITAWKAIVETENGQVPPEIFQTNFSTSSLRVVDPLLAEAYRKHSKKMQDRFSADSDPTASQNGEPAAAKNGNGASQTPDAAPVEEPAEIKSEAARKADALLEVFSRKDNFADLRNIGFFSELNDLLVRYPNDTETIQKELEPVFTALFSAVENWVAKVGSERYVVSDDDLTSLDWTTSLPQAVGEWKVLRKNQPIQVGEYIRGQLFAMQNELARASSASIELNLNLQIRDLLTRIKALRKKLDTENMAQFKVMIENGDYESAKQIIDLHYLEYPSFYERLRTEMSHQQDEGDDKKSMALINSLLNDLSTGGNMETGKYIKNQNNIPYINQKISSFRQKNAQLFDIQDELIRTKNLANDARKASADLKHITMINVILLVVVIVLTVALLATVLAKNFGLERNVARLETNLRSFQETYEANEKATLPPTQEVINTPIVITEAPTVTPVPPTVESTETLPNIDQTADAGLSPADLHLKSLVGANVVFNLDGNVDLFGDELLTNEKKLGIIINYVQNVSGTLVSYNERAVNLQIPFNIGRSQISASTMLNVLRGTNIRQFSDVPAETTPVFISQVEIVLSAPATNCTDGQQSFCHGLISAWIPRDKIETTIK